jgi:hypothetical protein
VVGDERPGKAVGTGVNRNLPQPFYEGISIRIVLKNFVPLYPTDNQMMQRAGSVYSSFSRHATLLR